MSPGTIVKRVISGFVMVIKTYPPFYVSLREKVFSGPSASRDVAAARLTTMEAAFNACRSSWRFGRNTVAVSQFRVCSLRRRVLQRDLRRPRQWDALTFGAFPGCVTRCFTLTSRLLPPKWLSTSRDVAIFSFSFLFFGRAKNLGTCEATKDHSGASSRKQGKEGASGGASDSDSLHTALWHKWPSNAPLKDADLNWDTATVSTVAQNRQTREGLLSVCSGNRSGGYYRCH